MFIKMKTFAHTVTVHCGKKYCSCLNSIVTTSKIHGDFISVDIMCWRKFKYNSPVLSPAVFGRGLAVVPVRNTKKVYILKEKKLTSEKAIENEDGMPVLTC